MSAFNPTLPFGRRTFSRFRTDMNQRPLSGRSNRSTNVFNRGRFGPDVDGVRTFSVRAFLCARLGTFVTKQKAFKPIMVMMVGIIASSSPACAEQDVPPPGSPPPLTEAERAPLIPGVQFSDVIQAMGEKLSVGLVHEGEDLLHIPYRYRHTAVLTEDVKGFSFTVGGVQAPAGTPGYYAGSFASSRSGATSPHVSDMWCFFPRAAGGKRENICLLRTNPKLAAIAPTRMNPYLWEKFSPITGTFNYVRTPIFSRQAIDLPIKPVLEYRFLSWKNDVAALEISVLGSSVSRAYVSSDRNGEHRLRTIAGDFILSRDEHDPTSARIGKATAPLPNSNYSIRVRLTINADGFATDCVSLDNDAPKRVQDEACKMVQRHQFAERSTVIEPTLEVTKSTIR